MEHTQVAIIGGGIAGLTLAYALKKKNISVRLLESANRVGGALCSKHCQGFELDLGPNSLIATPFLTNLLDELQLSGNIMPAEALSKNRFLVREKMIHALPPHPIKLLKSPYFSGHAKWRLLTERFRQRKAIKEESVASFFTRRFGKEISDYAADPIFCGIYAGDIEKLSVQQVMPVLSNWEATYGSVIKGVMANKGKMKNGRQIISLKGGLQELARALAVTVSDAVVTGAQLKLVEQADEKFRLDYEQTGQTHQLSADYLVNTAPLTSIVSIPYFASLVSTVSAIEYSPVRTLHVTVPAGSLQLPPGFGFLVPSKERLALMGCIFSSCIFPEKAPEGRVLLTVMIGGAHHKQRLAADADGLQQEALQQLQALLQITVAPEVLSVQTWQPGIPQKNVGYEAVLEQLHEFEYRHPSFFFAGNYISGVSVGDTMQYATALADKIAG